MALIFQVLAILLPFLLCQEKSKAQFTIQSKPADLVYVEAGKTLRLNLTFKYNGDIRFITVTWYFNYTQGLVQKVGNNEPLSFPPGRATIEGQASLVLNRTTLKDNGTYSFAWTGIVTGNDHFTVVIEVKPIAYTNCSFPLRIKEGENVDCLCNYTAGNPPPFASWYKGNKNVSGPGYSEQTLSLKNITVKDAGNYSCTVESHGSNDTTQIEIDVLLKPTAVINCSTNVTVKEGNDVECLCYGTGGNPLPRASWSKNGKKVNGSGYLKKTLSLKSIFKENAGNYSCIVNNTIFEDMKQIEIIVQYKPINISFQSGNQNKYIAVVGENVTITCKAEGVPAPNYIILHNGTPLNTTDVVNGVTTIKSVQRSDYGRYQCIANNFLGNTNASFNLIVHERPTAEINCSSPFTVTKGDNFKCLCYSSGGYPPPNATWYNHGNKVGETESLNKTLLLKNITKEEAGNYNCTVQSLHLEDTKQIKLQVQYKPENISFESNRTNNMATVGDSITITCKADAFPSPNYTILHNGENLTDVLNGVKTLKSVKRRDNGSYICTAKNVLGNASKDLNLTVKESPCASAPCLHGGTCKNEGEAFVCTCATGYSGHQCQLKGLPCDSAPCFNGGTCKNEGEEFECTCPPNYNGTQCQEYVGGPCPCVVAVIVLAIVDFFILLVAWIWYIIKGLTPLVKKVLIGLASVVFVILLVIFIWCVSRGDNGGECCGLTPFQIALIAIAIVDLFILLLVLIWYVCRGNKGGECRSPTTLVKVLIALASVVFVILLVVLISDVYKEECRTLTKEKMTDGEIAGIAVGSGLLFILLVVLIYCCCKHGKCDRYKKERGESEVVLADVGTPNAAVAVEDGFNAYESVDKEKIKPNEEAGTSGDGEPARVDSPPSMPPVYAVVDKKSIKKKTPPDEEKPASGEDDNAAPAAAPSILPQLYAAVDKGAQQKERDAKPDSLTYASLDPVLLQPDSSKMRDRSHEETNYATIDMEKLHRDKT